MSDHAGVVTTVAGVVEEVRRKHQSYFERHPLRLALRPRLCAALAAALDVRIEAVAAAGILAPVDRYAAALLASAAEEPGADPDAVRGRVAAYIAAERSRRARAETLHASLERHMVALDGVALPYVAGGSGAPPLVLLNAIGQGLEPWYPLMERLMPRRRVLAWELRGERPDRGSSTIDDHVAALAAIVDREGAVPCDLLGWCAGAKIAVAYCLQRPAAVRSAVLLNGSFKHPGRSAAYDTPYERDLEAVCSALDRHPERAPQVRRLLASAALPAPDEHDGAAVLAATDPRLRDAVARPFADDAGMVSYARQHLAYWSSDVTVDGARLRVPVVFAAGEYDRIVGPAGVREAARRFPASRFVALPGASHHRMYDRPDLVAALLDESTHG